MPAVIGCDAQKQFSVFVTLDGKTSPAVRVDHPRQEYVDFLSSLPPGSEIALEATGHWYWMVDEMEKSVHHRHLAKPTEAKKRIVVLFFLVAQLVAKLQFHQIAQQTHLFWWCFRGDRRIDSDALEGLTTLSLAKMSRFALYRPRAVATAGECRVS